MAFLQDKQDARARELGIVQVTKKRDYLLYGLAYLFSVPFVVVFVVVFVVGLPEQFAASAELIVTRLETIMEMIVVGGVVHYFFGSSKTGNSNDSTDGSE